MIFIAGSVGNRVARQQKPLAGPKVGSTFEDGACAPGASFGVSLHRGSHPWRTVAMTIRNARGTDERP